MPGEVARRPAAGRATPALHRAPTSPSPPPPPTQSSSVPTAALVQPQQVNPESPLGQSLERGILAHTFTSFERIGRGGFGEVFKAWSTESHEWVALKVIPVSLRENETIDDDCKVWCGLDLFKRLCRIRCPHVLRYHRRWTELPEDVQGALPAGSKVIATSATSSPSTKPSDPKRGGLLERPKLEPPSLCARWELDSDGGFEWPAASSSWDTSSLRSDPSPTRRSPRRRPTKDVYDEVPIAKVARPQRVQAVLLIQMEYYEGVTLQSWLVNPDVRHGLSCGSFQGSLDLFAQLVAGLAELHFEGIVHRDVKPENIIISKHSGTIKLIDFGLACLRSSQPPTPAEDRGGPAAPPNVAVGGAGGLPASLAGAGGGGVGTRSSLFVGKVPSLRSFGTTQPGGGLCSQTALGTPGYAPPEHCTSNSRVSEVLRRALSAGSATGEGGSELGGGSAGCCDIYSAGVVLVELLMAATRQGPAWGTAMERAVAFRALRAGYAASELPPELRCAPEAQVPGWLRRLITRMLSVGAEARPSADEVVSELSAGLRCRDRTNPFMGTVHATSGKIPPSIVSPLVGHNPYVGFFMDHRPKVA